MIIVSLNAYFYTFTIHCSIIMTRPFVHKPKEMDNDRVAILCTLDDCEADISGLILTAVIFWQLLFFYLYETYLSLILPVNGMTLTESMLSNMMYGPPAISTSLLSAPAPPKVPLLYTLIDSILCTFILVFYYVNLCVTRSIWQRQRYTRRGDRVPQDIQKLCMGLRLNTLLAFLASTVCIVDILGNYPSLLTNTICGILALLLVVCDYNSVWVYRRYRGVYDWIHWLEDRFYVSLDSNIVPWFCTLYQRFAFIMTCILHHTSILQSPQHCLLAILDYVLIVIFVTYLKHTLVVRGEPCL